MTTPTTTESRPAPGAAPVAAGLLGIVAFAVVVFVVLVLTLS
jgi:hypothetical protein